MSIGVVRRLQSAGPQNLATGRIDVQEEFAMFMRYYVRDLRERRVLSCDGGLFT